MKISAVETLTGATSRKDVTFVRIRTDEGVDGISEVFAVGPDDATAVWVDYYAAQIVGQDPDAVEWIWELLYRGTRYRPGSSGMAALSAIDLALWDIKGRALGLPVYKLLGGAVRDRVPVYLDVSWDDPDDEQRAVVERALADGYKAFKTGPLPSRWRELEWGDALAAGRAQLRELRELVGPAVEIGLDAHAQHFEPWRALQLADALAEYRPSFIEEPLRMENRAAMAGLRRRYPVPLATGETLYTKFEFEELIAADGVDLIQPDILMCGGMTEIRKIAFIAEARDVSVAPHNPNGPVATLSSAHFAMATLNCPVLEYRPPTDDEVAMAPGARLPVDGYIEVSDSPGWGIELDEEAIAARPPQRRRYRVDRFNPDGSVAFS